MSLHKVILIIIVKKITIDISNRYRQQTKCITVKFVNETTNEVPIYCCCEAAMNPKHRFL